MVHGYPVIEVSQIRQYCIEKNFDVVRINHPVADMTSVVQKILADYPLIAKDGYDTYEAIGLQYDNDANPLYDAVQQTGFISSNLSIRDRQPKRFTKQNEIGELFDLNLSQYGIHLERGRILNAKSGHVHNEHLDYDMRIHLPIITNPEAIMVYSGQQYHMETGFIYLINGFRSHHFYNKGPDRIHIAWLISKDLYR